MTDIKGTPHVPQPNIGNAGSHAGGWAQGQTQRQAKEQQSQQEGGTLRSNSSVFVSQNALEARISALQGEARHTGQDDSSNHDEPETPEQLLVSLEVGKSVSADTVVAKDTTAADRMAKTETLANLVASRVDSTLRAGPAMPSGSVAMTLRLEPHTGLSGVQVSVSDGVLAVVLVRSAEAGDQNLHLAAASLAQILQSRFPTRQIKISERVEEALVGGDVDAPSQTEAGFAHLFRTERDAI